MTEPALFTAVALATMGVLLAVIVTAVAVHDHQRRKDERERSGGGDD